MPAHSPSRRRALVALLGLLGGAVLSVTSATPASADEVYTPSPDGSFAIEGHGWGHGHGLSQYGAQGAASQGVAADAITAFYYPGTAKATIANSAVRVLLSADEGTDTQVFAASGLTVTDVASGATATLPSGPTRWRAVVDSAGLHVQSLTGSTWAPYTLAGRTALAGPVRFGGPTFVRVAFPDGSSRDYRGAVQAVQRTATTLASVDVLGLEDYLLGVVPRESSSSWQPAALQAQAIAARSYSAYERAHVPSGAAWDICDTTMCQVFGGSALYTASGSRTALEPQSTTDAVHATAGVVRTYQGAPIFAQFSASNGGWTTAGGQPYLIAQKDDWDGAVPSSVHSWTATITAAQLQARYPAVGTLMRLRVTARDGNGEWGGRVQTVVLEGVDGSGNATSVTTTGAGVYNAHSWPGSSDGLRSSWWHVVPSTSSTVVAQSAAPTLVQSPGASSGTLTVSLRNSGTTTWPVAGLHLAVASPPGQADPLVGGSTRPGSYLGDDTHPGASAVVPGDVVRFSFALTGDGVAPGVHGRAYQLRNDAGALYGTTVSWRIPVQAPVLTATVGTPTSGAGPAGSSAGPRPVFADGRTVVVPTDGTTTLELPTRNTGNVTWPAGSSSPVLLGTSGPRDRTSTSYGADWVSGSRVGRVSGTSSVAPGASGTFELALHGNGRPVGVTDEAFEPVWEGIHWLDGALTALHVVRVDTHTSRVAMVDTAPPAALSLQNAPTGTATLRVRMRNLGADPWPVGQEALTVDGGTPLATSAWASSSRPPALAGNVTRPGQGAVYPGEVGEWRVPLSAFRKAAGSYLVALHPVGYGPKVTTKVTVTAATFSGAVVWVHPSVTVPRTGTATTWYDVKNTGNTAWPVGGAVRSFVLSSSGSPSRASSWLSPTRPSALRGNVTRPGATTVRPGEVGRFLVVLAGNNRTPRTASEPFGVLWEGWTRTAVRAVLAYAIR